MTPFPNTSLRQMLTVPYVVLVLLAAAIIGVLSYRAGSEAVDSLSDLVLSETTNRIAQAVDKHVSGSEAVLETVFPTGVAAPSSIKSELEKLRVRLWLATSIHRDPNNYAYYGDRHGQFIGLWRFSESEAELRLRTDSESPRSIYRFSSILGPLQNAVIEPTMFDPRERPWFKAGQKSEAQTWTAIYIDFKTLELVSTRARRVDDLDGEFEGVVATDISLQHLNDFLKTLSLSENGVAFIVERDGNILATSRGPHLRKGVGEDNTRLNAAHSDDQLIASTYRAVSELARSTGATSATQTTMFEDSDSSIVQVGFSRLQDTAGLDWLVAVAVPRQDFMHKVTRNLHRTVAMAIAVCVLIVLLGLCVLNRVVADLRRLAGAARAMSDGYPYASVPLERTDEIGDLAKAFSDLQARLLTDRLTGIANREAIIRRLEDRIIRHRRRSDLHPFALLFIDLNSFKAINDKFGHDVGDQVLVEVAERLSQGIRDNDMAARFGGDEFIVLLEKVSHRADVTRACEHLHALLKNPYKATVVLTEDPSAYAKGASIGFALYPDDGQDLETLMKRADEQMYTEKSTARLDEDKD